MFLPMHGQYAIYPFESTSISLLLARDMQESTINIWLMASFNIFNHKKRKRQFFSKKHRLTTPPRFSISLSRRRKKSSFKFKILTD